MNFSLAFCTGKFDESKLQPLFPLPSTPAPGLDSRKTHRHFARKRIPTCSLFRFRILISPPRHDPLTKRETARKLPEAANSRYVCARKARRPRKKILNFRSKGNYARVKSPFMSLPVSTPPLSYSKKRQTRTRRNVALLRKGTETSGKRSVMSK